MLGKLVAESGSTVVLSDYVIDHCILNKKFGKSLAHQWNWMKSTRFSRPAGHLGTGLTFGVPFGLIVFMSALLIGKPWFGLAALAWTVMARVLQSALVGWLAVKDKESVRLAWLYPLRDLRGGLLWLTSYASRRVGWRDDSYELRKSGVVRIIGRAESRAGLHH